ncbi:hypothetical protein GGF39_002407 [Coemansia sp. RSA 1721]|nr:hypothetical protein GGF39_002407 [Coemansia sp. RSA 1721]
MSRLPRGSVAGTTATTVSGGIRPPSSGMTLPRSFANRDFMSELPTLSALPALTQNAQSGTPRAALTNSTFTPPSAPPQSLPDATTTIGRPSANSSRSVFGGSVSPSPGAVSPDTAPSLVMRSPAPTAAKDVARLAILSRSLTRSPTRSSDLGSMNHTDNTLPDPSESSMPNTQTTGSSAMHQRTTSVASKQPSGSAAHLQCGEPVFIPVQGLRGTLRYLGPIDGKQGTWAGVELEEAGKGKNDGSVAGKSYFTCLPNTGLFLVPSKVEPLPGQKHSSAGGTEDQIPSISAVLSSASTEISSAQVGRLPGPAKRATRSTTTPMAPQRIQARSPGRSRISSDATLQTTLPNVAGSVSNNSSSSGISSPANNRRRAHSRIAAAPPGPGFASEAPTPSRSRPPPATISRGTDKSRSRPPPATGTGRPRPLSTTGSIASNRTSSPPLSRPSSRSLAPSAVEQPHIAAMGTPRQLPHLRSATTVGDAHAPASAPAVRRRLAVNGTAGAAESSGKLSGTGPRAKASNSTADPVDRLRLRIDMLEAENRVLRLKNEQDKAHLAASQMLARDLVGTATPMSPQLRSTIDGIGRLSLRSPMAASFAASAAADVATSSSFDAMQKQLLEANEQLERERKQSQSQIATLQTQINELSAGMAQSKESQTDSKENVDSGAADNEAVAELEARLAKAEQEHALELAAAQSAQNEALHTLELRLAEAETFQSQLSAKSAELSSLNARLDKSAADLTRMTNMYEELVAQREQQQEDGLAEESELVASLKKQMDKLRRDFVDAEEQRQALSDSLDAATASRTETEARLSKLLPDLEQLRLRTSDYDEKCAIAQQYSECVREIVQLVQIEGFDDGDRKIDAESAESLDSSDLLSLSKRLISQLVEHASALGQRSAETAGEVMTKDARISELESELEEVRRLAARDAAKDQNAEKHSDPAENGVGDVQSRIDELERINSELIDERNQFIQDQVVFNDYLEKLESESNRLVDDIEQLTVENQRLTEELRMASLHNSTVSLDVAAIDSRLASELAEGEICEQSGSANLSKESGSDAADYKNSGPVSAETKANADADADADALQQKHQREIGLMQVRIADLELRKNNEIKRLQDEIGTLEDLVEDKIFSESELNDKIASLSNEVDRLEREIRHLRGSGANPGTANTSAADGTSVPSKSINASLSTGDGSFDRPVSNAGNTGTSVTSVTATNPALSDKHHDDDEDELMYCDICDVSTHRIADCPEIAGTSSMFKQEVSIDSSRPYCDNCELFDHWTDECPHGDEMF